jgi:hypothetical protein
VLGHVFKYKMMFYGLGIKSILYLGRHGVMEHVNKFVSKMFAEALAGCGVQKWH